MPLERRSGVLVVAALLLAAETAAAAITGRVVAADGQPLAGATVRAYAPETQKEAASRTLAGRARTPVATTVTDHDGAFRLDAMLPLAGVEAHASGFAPAFAASGGDHPLMLRATPAAPLRAVITAGGRPLAGALVVWTAGSVIGPIAEVMARTGEDGSYEVPDPAAWAHQGVILHARLLSARPQPTRARRAPDGAGCRDPRHRGGFGRPPASRSDRVDRRPSGLAARALGRARCIPHRSCAGVVGLAHRPAPRASASPPARRTRSRSSSSRAARSPVTSGTKAGARWPARPSRSATSEAPTLYSVRVHPAVHHVSFRKAGLAPKVVTGFDGAAGRPLDIVLEPGVSVSGRVVRPGGRGVAAVEVVLERPHAGDLARMTTSADGRFAFPGVAPGPYELRVHDGRYGTTHSRPVEAPAEDLEVRFAASGSVLGRVVDAQTRRPVTAYDVLVEWTAGFGDGDRSKSVSSPTGSFAVSGVPARPVTVTVHALGYVPAKSEVTVSAGGDTPELQLALVADRPIRGRVTSGDGVSLSTAYVVARDVADVHVGGARCDSEGRFELRGLAAQPITLTVHAPGFAPATQALDAAHTEALEVVLDRGLTLRGEVLLDSVPLPGAMVTLPLRNERPRTATTDEHGRFSLDGLAEGRYAVTARAPAPERATITLEDVEVPSAVPLRVVMPRRPTANLAGRVVGLESEDVIAVVVTARNQSGNRVTAHVRSDLTFRMPDAPVGQFKVTAYANTRRRGTRAARTTELTLAAGESADAAVQFTSDAVHGLVTRNGEPVPHVYVSFTTPELFRASGRTDAGGRYEALGLEPGRYTVQVSGNDVLFTTERTIAIPGAFDIEVAETPPMPR